MLKINNVTKTFGGLTAVNDVSFEVREGSIVGLIGPNGSGKTTLFNCITGVYPLTKGSVEFNGENISKMASPKIANLGLVRTFQVVKPFTNISVLDNIVVGAFQRNRNRKIAEKHAMEAMELVGIEKYKDDFPGGLPIAIKKKLEIARIMSTKPKMIMLDEVMGGLNETETDQLVDTIVDINKSGITVMLIEHKMRCIMKISEDVVVLNNGAMIAHGSGEEVVSNPEVIKAYLGGDFVAETNKS